MRKPLRSVVSERDSGLLELLHCHNFCSRERKSYTTGMSKNVARSGLRPVWIFILKSCVLRVKFYLNFQFISSTCRFHLSRHNVAWSEMNATGGHVTLNPWLVSPMPTAQGAGLTRTVQWIFVILCLGIVVGRIVAPESSHVKTLTPGPSECDCLWRRGL